MTILNFDSVIDFGSRSIKGKTVREILDENRRNIFDMISKYHVSFSDDVLSEAHITKVEHEHKVYQEEIHIQRDKDIKEPKKLKKDTKNIEDILDEMFDNYHNTKEDANSSTTNNYSESDNDINNTVMTVDSES